MAFSVNRLVPSDPETVMVLRKVTPDILTCSTPFLRLGRFAIGGRGTIVKLATGSLAVFSPVALTETVKKELANFGTGEVKYITALDQEHHIFLESWHKAFPNAKVLGPDTLPEYRNKQKYFQIPSSNWHLFKGATSTPNVVSEEFDREFDFEYIHSHANKELVFNHKPSKTLIEADLIFNLPATEQMSKSGVSAEQGFLTRLFTSLNNTRGDAIWQKRFVWYVASASDRKAFNASIARINSWDFDRLIPCHGDVIETGGKGIFQKIMGWHLEGKK